MNSGDSNLEGGEWTGELPDDLSARIKPELAPGERLIWAGQPSSNFPGRARYPTIAIQWTIGLGLVAIAFLWIGQRPGGPEGAVAVGFSAALIGAVLAIIVFAACAHVRAERRRLARTGYALTDRRALIWRPRSNSPAIDVFTHPARSIDRIHRTEYPDGSGDVVFSHTFSPDGFFAVANVRRVEALAREVLLDPEASRYRQRVNSEDVEL